MDKREIPIPEGAVGRPGLVAQLRRVGPGSEGRLVLVQKAVGPMSSLSSSPRPVFAWQVLLLGATVDINGKACRDIVVADACLRPVYHLEGGEVRAVVEQRALQDLQLGLDNLRRLLAGLEHGEAALAQIGKTSTSQVDGVGDEIRSLLRVQSIAVSLFALGFRMRGEDDHAGWHWSGHHQGVELYVTAGPDMFGRWALTGRLTNSRQMMWSEALLWSTEPFGAVALKLLNMWRDAFGTDVPPPSNVTPGLVYEKHLADMRPLRVVLPTLWADGEVLRAIRRWLRQRAHRSNDGEIPADSPLDLSFAGDVLHLGANGQTYGCPASGVWMQDCAVSLRDFVDTPAWVMRGACVCMEQPAQALVFNGAALLLCKTLTTR